MGTSVYHTEIDCIVASVFLRFSITWTTIPPVFAPFERTHEKKNQETTCSRAIYHFGRSRGQWQEHPHPPPRNSASAIRIQSRPDQRAGWHGRGRGNSPYTAAFILPRTDHTGRRIPVDLRCSKPARKARDRTSSSARIDRTL